MPGVDASQARLTRHSAQIIACASGRRAASSTLQSTQSSNRFGPVLHHTVDAFEAKTYVSALLECAGQDDGSLNPRHPAAVPRLSPIGSVAVGFADGHLPAPMCRPHGFNERLPSDEGRRG